MSPRGMTTNGSAGADGRAGPGAVQTNGGMGTTRGRAGVGTPDRGATAAMNRPLRAIIDINPLRLRGGRNHARAA
jgi:hypothetical protein